jgi:hypothetical protein
MVRAAHSVAVFLVLAAWAGAQGPAHASLSAAEQLHLHRANRNLLANLVDSGVRMGRSSHPIDRAEECRRAARHLGVALQQAAESNDPDAAERVAELGNHFDLVVRDGLVPMIDEARRTIHPMSPDAVRLKVLRESANDDLNSAFTAIPTNGALGDNARVREVSAKLGSLKEKLK